MAYFKITVEPLVLTLRHTFTISRGSRDRANNLLIRIQKDGIEGLGEAAPNSRYGETPESAAAFISKINFTHLDNPFDLEALWELLNKTGKGEYSAKAAVEMAVADWLGKKLSLPLHRLWNAPSTVGPRSSVTIGISNPGDIKKRIEEAIDFPVLKVKLGGRNDVEVMRLVRELTDKTIWVDANEGWLTYKQALNMSGLLSDLGVELIEQPMPASQKEDLEKLKQHSNIPIIADEGFKGSELFTDIAQRYDGINIKLMKIGGMSRALKTIARARMYNMKIMIGCMVESSIANTAAAIVSQWADYADLDGPFLISDNPYEGFRLDSEARVTLNDSPGLGVKKIR